jgi:hypothetical protein
VARGERLASLGLAQWSIPAREAWLYKNRAAMKSLQRGLGQAKRLQFSDPPLGSV